MDMVCKPIVLGAAQMVLNLRDPTTGRGILSGHPVADAPKSPLGI